jgi:ATP-binding protein involved in chromosome partitioning
MDPRIAIIEGRLKEIKKIIAVAGGKGGVGKSSVAATLALTLFDMGHRVGLLDLDFYGPSTHIILGIDEVVPPREDKGILPPRVRGLKFLSIVHYAGDKPSPLRGSEVSSAIIELLAITRWGELDFLVVDMPPGIGDTTLDAIRLLENRAQFLVVTTPSRLAVETVKKLLALLKELDVPLLGVIENMKKPKDTSVKNALKSFKVPVVGSIPFDDHLEESLGNQRKFSKTVFAEATREIIQNNPGLKGRKRRR